MVLRVIIITTFVYFLNEYGKRYETNCCHISDILC
jgi:hypothetical protein